MGPGPKPEHMHRNNPYPITGLSPAQIKRDWRQAADARAEAYSHRKFTMQDKLSQGAKHLHPLKVGDHVLIQDQHGNNPKQWTKTGVVTEVGPYDSYLVSVDGSRQVTKRNRRFLRLIKPDKPYAQSSEAFQTPPRLRPGQSSSPPGTSSTTLPVILPPPRAPEPELPAVAQPASPLPVNSFMQTYP